MCLISKRYNELKDDKSVNWLKFWEKWKKKKSKEKKKKRKGRNKEKSKEKSIIIRFGINLINIELRNNVTSTYYLLSSTIIYI